MERTVKHITPPIVPMVMINTKIWSTDNVNVMQTNESRTRLNHQHIFLPREGWSRTNQSTFQQLKITIGCCSFYK
jgi:hypothetical protein